MIGFIHEDGSPGDKWEFKTLPEGASTFVDSLSSLGQDCSISPGTSSSHIVAAFEPSLKGGEYLDDCQVQPDVEAYAVNPVCSPFTTSSPRFRPN